MFWSLLQYTIEIFFVLEINGENGPDIICWASYFIGNF